VAIVHTLDTFYWYTVDIISLIVFFSHFNMLLHSACSVECHIQFSKLWEKVPVSFCTWHSSRFLSYPIFLETHQGDLHSYCLHTKVRTTTWFFVGGESGRSGLCDSSVLVQWKFWLLSATKFDAVESMP